MSSGPASAASRSDASQDGAAIAVGEHGAVDVRDDQVDALERERAERPRRDRPGLGERQPAGRTGGAAIGVGHARAACARLRLGHALDLEAEQVGRGLLERLLDRELERRRRGRAAVAVADEAQVRDAVLEPQQLDVAAVRLHVRPHARERLLHARLERHRVEVVDQQQAADHAIAREPEQQLLLSALRQLARRCASAPRRTAR